MIKKIAVEKLRPGMYIHDLGCNWIQHPFLQNRLTITSADQILKIKKLGVQYVYIDTSRGVDVNDIEKNNAVSTNEEPRDLLNLASRRDRTSRRTTHSYATERERALTIKNEAMSMIHHVMDDVIHNREIRVDTVYDIVDDMIESVSRNDQALTTVLRMKSIDEYTYLHSVSVCALFIAFSRCLNLSDDEMREGALGAMLHDIGKMSVPLTILNKAGPLTHEEFKIIQLHTTYGKRILDRIDGIPATARDIAYGHHERYDGSGYPRGLKNSEISAYNKIVSVVDVFDAMTSERCYSKGATPDVIIRYLFELRDKSFAADIVESFIKCVGIYPVGTCVRLENGLIGIVNETNVGNILFPLITIVFDTKKDRRITPYTVNLEDYTDNDGFSIASTDNPDRWHIDPFRYVDHAG